MQCIDKHKNYQKLSKVSKGPGCEDTKADRRPSKENDLQVHELYIVFVYQVFQVYQVYQLPTKEDNLQVHTK